MKPRQASALLALEPSSFGRCMVKKILVQAKSVDGGPDTLSLLFLMLSLWCAAVRLLQVQLREEQKRRDGREEEVQRRKRQRLLGELPMAADALATVFASSKVAVLSHRDIVAAVASSRAQNMNQSEPLEPMTVIAGAGFPLPCISQHPWELAQDASCCIHLFSGPLRCSVCFWEGG